jgi:proteasome activator subunit 4
MDKGPAGWLVTDGTLSGYSVPDEFRSTFQPWEAASQGAVDVVRRATTQEAFWKKLSGRYSEENHQTTVTQDNISCVKSICLSATFSCKPL